MVSVSFLSAKVGYLLKHSGISSSFQGFLSNMKLTDKPASMFCVLSEVHCVLWRLGKESDGASAKPLLLVKISLSQIQYIYIRVYFCRYGTKCSV